jgi:hypothetical protein
MAPPVVFDLLRLYLSASAIAPRGIDRIDLAYARFLFATWPGDCAGLLPTPWGLRLYDRRRVLRGLDTLEAMWREYSIGPDAALTHVVRRLSGADVSLSDRDRAASSHRAAPRLARFLLANGLAAGTPVITAAAPGSLYLNIGQLGWAVPWMVSWLRRRPDVRAVFMLHDAIPIERPDLVTPLARTAHRRMMTAAARHAAGLIFTTQVAAQSVLRLLPPHGGKLPLTTSLHLPLAPSFLGSVEQDPALARHPYFVVVGAIEPRKNHLILLNIWCELLRRRRSKTPRLVIAGSPARGSRSILRQLRASTMLRDHLVIASDLSSPALRQLVANARAVLMPSLAEGFGLPIVEALALGTPMLASDLPAHREVGADLAIYLGATDEAAWLREIGRFTDGDDSTAALRRRIASYRPTTSQNYFDRIAGFLQSIG